MSTIKLTPFWLFLILLAVLIISIIFLKKKTASEGLINYYGNTDVNTVINIPNYPNKMVKLFDNDYTTYWTTTVISYLSGEPNPDDNVNRFTSSTGTTNGGWVKMLFETSVNVDSYKLSASSEEPLSWILYGSNSDIHADYVPIHSVTNHLWTTAIISNTFRYETFTFSNPISYKNYVLQITKIKGNNLALNSILLGKYLN